MKVFKVFMCVGQSWKGPEPKPAAASATPLLLCAARCAPLLSFRGGRMSRTNGVGLRQAHWIAPWPIHALLHVVQALLDASASQQRHGTIALKQASLDALHPAGASGGGGGVGARQHATADRPFIPGRSPSRKLTFTALATSDQNRKSINSHTARTHSSKSHLKRSAVPLLNALHAPRFCAG